MNHQELLEAFKKAFDGVDVPSHARCDLTNPEYVICHYDLMKIRKPKTSLELGVRYGFSTLAMLLAANEDGGRVWSVDLKIMREAVQAVNNLGLRDKWSYFEMDDLKFAEMWRSMEAFKFDYIYIDSEHTYEHCRKEIEAFYPLLNLGGIIGFHDVSAGQGKEIFRAIKEFLAQHPSCKFTGYEVDIGIIYTQEKVLLKIQNNHEGCGGNLYTIEGFEDPNILYRCVKCGGIVKAPYAWRKTMEVTT